MARLTKKKASLKLRSGASEAFMIQVTGGGAVQSVAWALSDSDGGSVTLPGFIGQRQYSGARAEFDKDGFYIRAGDTPTYAALKLTCTVTTRSAKGLVETEKLTADITFFDEWGGMAKAWYPYPDDYEMKWLADRPGQRAVVLMHEIIALLPEEFRTAAGAIPIIRTSNDASWRGDKFRGAHLPLAFDTIQIADSLVKRLQDVDYVSDVDLEFVAVVVHEIGHAVTYRKCLWNMHHAMAEARKMSRRLAPGPLAPVGWVHDAYMYQHAGLVAVAQNLLAPQDVVSEFAEIAGWELTGWLARAVRTLQVPASLMDLGQWLWRLPSQGLNQHYPLRPNLATGNSDVGQWFGLKATAIGDLRRPFEKASTKLLAAKNALDKSVGKARAAAQLKYDKARAEYDKVAAPLQKTSAAAGFVSHYATQDANEDMSETLTFYLMDAADIAREGEYYGDRSNPVLKKKRKFFADQGYLPKRDFPPLKVGSLWLGLEAKQRLNLWKVEL